MTGSNTGIDPKLWGPAAWIFLHSIVQDYPDNPTQEQQNNYRIFFESLGNVLPCKFCTKHYYQFAEQHPPQLNSKLELSHWVYSLHNNVNKLTHKTTRNPSFEEIVNKYKELSNNDGCNVQTAMCGDNSSDSKCEVCVTKGGKKIIQTGIEYFGSVGPEHYWWIILISLLGFLLLVGICWCLYKKFKNVRHKRK